MKQLLLSLAATVLTMALTIPALAGDMETTITSQSQTPLVATAGDMETGVTATDNTADSLTEIARGFMQSMLSLF
jgi:hypothetical protein